MVAQYLLQNSIWWTKPLAWMDFASTHFPTSRANSGQHGTLACGALSQSRHHWRSLSSRSSVTSFFAGGQKRFDNTDTAVTTLFDYPLYFTLRDVLLNGAPAGRIADLLRHDSLYPRPESLITFFGNHDVTRFASAKDSSLIKQELAFGLILTLRGIPQFYYADEIGMPGGNDPDNRHDFPGGWREDPKNAFMPEGRTVDQQKLFSYLQSVLRVRQEHPVLTRGRLWHLASDDSSYIFERDSDEEKIVVAFNNSKTARDLKVPLKDTPAQGSAGVKTLLGDAHARVTDGDLQLTCRPNRSLFFCWIRPGNPLDSSANCET